MRNVTIRRVALLLIAGTIAAMIFTGCTVHPPGEREERAAATQLGQRYQKPIEARELPSLPDHPTADDLVHYAMLNSGELESRYWQWRAAIEQIPQDGTQSTTLNLSLGAALTNGHTSNRMTTLALGNDPMTDIKWPTKLDAAARIALENARAAGLRFRKAQFELRGKVLDAYSDYVLTTEQIRLEEANQQLLQTIAIATESGNRAGSASQADVLKARNEIDLSDNDLENLKAQLPAERAALNALLCRSAESPISMSEDNNAPRPLAYDAAQLIAIVAKQNPELAALDAEAHGHVDAVRLAKLQYLPDFNLSAGTDLAGLTQNLLGQATFPLLRHEALDAAIAQAEANLKASQATKRQAGSDLASQVIMDVSTIHDADRQLDLFEQSILPRTRQAVDLMRTRYETGHATLMDLLDGQRTLISIERLTVNLRSLRAKRLSNLEAIAGAELTVPHPS